jgi:hypothetical protein
VEPRSALRNTAVPGTRTGGLTKMASRKAGRSMASLRSRSASSMRPRVQVVMSVNIAAPMSSGNQPPSSTFTALAAKKTRSTTKKKPVAARHSDSGSRQPQRTTKKVMTVVIVMSMVTAMP